MDAVKPGFRTIRATAEWFGVSTSTIWKWLGEGRLESILLSNRRLIPTESSERLAAELREQARANPQRRWDSATARERNRASRQARVSDRQL
jgi:predicted site-specific integrase-resolvase